VGEFLKLIIRLLSHYRPGHMLVVMLSALRTGRLYPPPSKELSLVFFSVRRCVDSRAIGGRKDWGKKKWRWPHRESNLQPSSLYRSDSSNYGAAYLVSWLLLAELFNCVIYVFVYLLVDCFVGSSTGCPLLASKTRLVYHSCIRFGYAFETVSMEFCSTLHRPYSLHSVILDGQSGGTDITGNTPTINGHSLIFVSVRSKTSLSREISCWHAAHRLQFVSIEVSLMTGGNNGNCRY
jgi:hypothetical protein